MFNSIDIDRRIEDLQRLKQQYQASQQPINIYNNTNTSTTDFKAQYIGENDNVEDLLVNCKTCFICTKNGTMKIKEINGDITEYIITKPKTEQELYIEELEKKVYEYEHNTTNNESTKSSGNVNEESKSSTKRSSKSVYE